MKLNNLAKMYKYCFHTNINIHYDMDVSLS